MDNLFPIRYWFELVDGIRSTCVYATTIPFCFNNEWYTITQEDYKQICWTRMYTINKSMPNVPYFHVLTSNFGEINLNEISEIALFMLNECAAEKKRRMHRVVNQAPLPMFSSLPTYWNHHNSLPPPPHQQQPFLWNQNNSSGSPFPHQQQLTQPYHYNRSTSTSDLTQFQPMGVMFGRSSPIDTRNRGSQYDGNLSVGRATRVFFPVDSNESTV